MRRDEYGLSVRRLAGRVPPKRYRVSAALEPFEWVDAEKPYREFVLPREVANTLGPPKLLAPEGSLRDPDPAQITDGQPVWGPDRPAT